MKLRLKELKYLIIFFLIFQNLLLMQLNQKNLDSKFLIISISPYTFLISLFIKILQKNLLFI